MFKANRLVVTSLAALTGVLLVSGCSKKKPEGESAGSATEAATPAASAESGTPGVTATEIKLGQSMPYSGPASAYGQIGKTEVAYFKMINEKGGINGRKVTLLSYDDAYVPAKAVEQTRKLVENDNVLAVVNSVGTANNTAVQPYLNQKKVPQLFVATGADKWADPEKNPWTMGWQPSYRTEAKVYAKYLLKDKPNAKVCVLFQNDDFGKDYLAGLHDALGENFDKVVIKTASYEVTDPTVDSQIVTLQGAGCDTLVSATTPKAAAGAIRKVADIGWKPTFFMSNVSVSQSAVLKPAGLDKSTGIITAQYLKDFSDPGNANDAGMNEYREFMKQYLPDSDPNDTNTLFGFGVANTLVQVLKQCGNDLSRANLMKQAASLQHFVTPVSIPGIEINTSATDFRPFSQMHLAKFNGTSFEKFGELVSAD
jgi:branched-chain amino acid transport system substrate-binding protein